MQYPENLKLSLTNTDEYLVGRLIITSDRSYYPTVILPIPGVVHDIVIVKLIDFINRSWSRIIKDIIKKKFINSLEYLTYEVIDKFTKLTVNCRELSINPIIIFNLELGEYDLSLPIIKNEINFVIRHLLEYLQHFDNDLLLHPVTGGDLTTNRILEISPVVKYVMHFDFELLSKGPNPMAKIEILVSSNYGYPGDPPVSVARYVSNAFDEETVARAQIEIAATIKAFNNYRPKRQAESFYASLAICGEYIKNTGYFPNYQHGYHIQLRDTLFEAVVKYNKVVYDVERLNAYTANIMEHGHILEGGVNSGLGKDSDKQLANCKFVMKNLIEKINAQLKGISKPISE